MDELLGEVQRLRSGAGRGSGERREEEKCQRDGDAGMTDWSEGGDRLEKWGGGRFLQSAELLLEKLNLLHEEVGGLAAAVVGA